MAFFDAETGQWTVQIVYDGVTFAGKTSSLRSLGTSLARPVSSPEEKGGRTVLFDWLEYTGGSFHGKPIHFRILTVPGYAEYQHNRRLLLEGADGLLFVADSTEAAWLKSVEHFRLLTKDLSGAGRDVPIVVQLNKRDMAPVVDREVADEALRHGMVRRTVETVATHGKGVQEAFATLAGFIVQQLEAQQLLAGTLLHSLSARRTQARAGEPPGDRLEGLTTIRWPEGDLDPLA